MRISDLSSDVCSSDLIRYKPEATIWYDDPSRFRLEPLHAGFLYQTPVDIFLVRDGQATLLPFSSSLFTYGKLVEPPAPDQTLFYTGFRVRTPLNAPDFWDELLIFQGASYFRAVAKGLIYGISARGLANKRTEERRGGKGSVSPGRVRWWQ